MLVLSRGIGETIKVSDDIYITVLGPNPHNPELTMLGIDAPKNIAIVRLEIDKDKKESAEVLPC